MRHAILGSLPALLVGVSLAWAEPEAPAKAEPIPAPKGARAAPPIVGVPENSPPMAPEAGPGHGPHFEPVYTTWTRLPPEFLCRPPAGIAPNDSCACKPLPERLWFRTELLIWWLRNDRLEPLATTGPSLTAVNNVAVDRADVFGGRVDDGAFTGARFTVGGWLDEDRVWGLEADYFFVGPQEQERFRNTARRRILTRPFFNLNTGTPSAQIVSFPNVAAGSFDRRSPTDFDGAEIMGRWNFCACWNDRADAVAGFRYLNLDEKLTVATNSANTAAAPMFPGATVTSTDSYHTRNEFDGINLGAELELRRECWFIHFRGKVGLGQTHQTLDIAGGTTVIGANGSVTRFAGGVLAEPSNIGSHERDRFSIVPEAGIDLAYQVTKHVRLSLGYSFLYWNNVIRPGSQPDFVVDVAQAPQLAPAAAPTGQRRPAVFFRETDFWAQGISLGAEIRY